MVVKVATHPFTVHQGVSVVVVVVVFWLPPYLLPPPPPQMLQQRLLLPLPPLALFHPYSLLWAP